MIITCIGHSGFLAELPGYNLIFDYFTDKKSVVTPELFKNKKTCVFISHGHYDHFSKKIFGWQNLGDVAYILDAGCKIPDRDRPENITMVREGDSVELFGGEITARAYGSTDEGVSFLVEAGGYTIFHAGDLNDWYWEDESTPEELLADEGNYLSIINKLAGQKIDVAFIPEDPRLGRNAGRGIAHFKNIVAPQRIIPMHFPGGDGIKY